ncbi:hypothetical protein [Mycolicibacter arupensis]|uniref:Uncharacterized protein n=1 Tax=Mycolicibacter arupensis TaxID=342002 RepID=A0A5C7XZ16_9MYCO|nr:hypothetical protein [Mycolicibacter arupensis]TXI54468.1 MAG: hypothetical protein E6Q54_14815 [Mycolicibacter arupensis]
MTEFTTDDIAIAITIPGLYDGTAVYLLKDGRLVNRFRQSSGWPARLIARADEWIAHHGDTCRKAHTDMLDKQVG